MAQQDKIGKHATTISRIDGRIIVTYHQTPIVTLDVDGTITLDSGGWRSSTTKTRMNQAASQLNLRFSIYQSDFQWFVRVKAVNSPFIPDTYYDRMAHACEGTLPFVDGMKFRVYQDARWTA